MKKPSRTEQKLIDENIILAQRIQQLEQSEAKRKQNDELNQTNKVLSKAQTILKNTLDISPALICTANANTGFFTEVNMMVTNILGYSAKEFCRIPIMELIHPEDREKTGKEISEQQAGNQTSYFENRYLCKNGTYKWLAWNGAEANKDGDIYAIALDINERKQAEKKLLRSQELLNQTGEMAKVGGWELDLHTLVFYFTDEMYQIYELPPGLVLNLEEGFKLYPPEVVLIFQKALAETTGENLPFDMETPITTPKGNNKWVRVQWRTEYINGKAVRLRGTLQDITERKQVEEALRVSEEKFRTIFDSAANLITSVNKEGILVESNKQSYDLLGYKKEELIGQSMSFIKHPDDMPKAKETLKEIIAVGYAFNKEYRMICKDGSIKYVEINSSAIHDGEGNFDRTLCIINDITERKQAEETLAQQMALFEAIFNCIPDAIVYVNIDREVVSINSAFSSILGFTIDDLSGKKTSFFYESLEEYEHQGRVRFNLTAAEHALPYEVVYRKKDGSLFPGEALGTVIKNAKGTVMGYIGVIRDITERKQAEKALRESEERFRSYVDFAPHGVFVADKNGNYMMVNSAACKITGYGSEELLSMNLIELYPPESLEISGERFKRVVNEGFASGEAAFIRKDGSKRFWTIDAVKLSDDRFLAFVVDITDRKKVERQKESIQEKMNFALEVVEMGAWDLNLTDYTVFRTIRHDQIFGYEDFLPEWTYEIFLEHVIFEDRQRVDLAFKKALESKGNWDFECRIIRCDGEERWIHAKGQHQAVGEEGAYMCGIVQDITNDKEIEFEKENLARFPSENPNPVIRVSHDGKILYSNVSGKSILTIWSVDIGEQVPEEWKRKIITVIESKKSILQEEWFGEKVFSVLIAYVVDADYVNLYGNNVTERKRAEEALRISEQKLQLIIDTSPIGICTVDPYGNFVTTNLAYEQMVGYSKEELRSLSFFEVTHPDDRPNNKKLFQDMISLQTAGFFVEKKYIRKDGTKIEVAVNASGIMGAEENARFGTAFVNDITERKLAEKDREMYVVQLEAQRVELERFTYTVSHDLKSPLITIKGFLGLLARDAEEGNIQRLHSDIKRINTAATKMGDLLDDLLDLSRIGRLANEPVDVSLDKLGHEVAEMLYGPIAEHGVRLEIESDMPIVRGDHIRLHEVLQNLVENAIKFMGDQTSPSIKIGSRIDDGETVCYVRDNGQGIDAVYADKIFGLFEQLDGHTEGTGIGLALVKRIIEYHGGRVWVESEGAGCGSTFCFSIPLKGEV